MNQHYAVPPINLMFSLEKKIPSCGLRSITQKANRPPLIRAKSAPNQEIRGGDVIPTTTSKRGSA